MDGIKACGFSFNFSENRKFFKLFLRFIRCHYEKISGSIIFANKIFCQCWYLYLVSLLLFTIHILQKQDLEFTYRLYHIFIFSNIPDINSSHRKLHASLQSFLNGIIHQYKSLNSENDVMLNKKKIFPSSLQLLATSILSLKSSWTTTHRPFHDFMVPFWMIKKINKFKKSNTL